MNDLEQTFRDGLRQAVADRPGGIRVDVDEVIARASSPDFVPETRWTPPRWLAAAAAVLVVAGLGVGLAVFRPSAGIPAAPAAPSPSATQFDASGLVGSKWWAVEIDGRSVTAARDDKAPSVTFTSTSELTFYDGCNGGMARYRLSPGLIQEFSVKLESISLALCLEGDSQRFDEALTAASSIRKNGELLEFLDPNDMVVLQFARADGTTPQPTSPPTNGVAVTIETASAPSTPSPTPTPTDPPTASSDPTAAVHLRIHNAAEVPITDLKIVFADQTVMKVAELAPRADSEFDTTVAGFPIVSMESTLAGRTYHLHKTDAAGNEYVSDPPIRPGDHTWTIKLINGRATIVINEKP